MDDDCVHKSNKFFSRREFPFCRSLVATQTFLCPLLGCFAVNAIDRYEVLPAFPEASMFEPYFPISLAKGDFTHNSFNDGYFETALNFPGRYLATGARSAVERPLPLVFIAGNKLLANLCPAKGVRQLRRVKYFCSHHKFPVRSNNIIIGLHGKNFS
jgi:hypothetical protein